MLNHPFVISLQPLQWLKCSRNESGCDCSFNPFSWALSLMFRGTQDNGCSAKRYIYKLLRASQDGDHCAGLTRQDAMVSSCIIFYNRLNCLSNLFYFHRFNDVGKLQIFRNFWLTKLVKITHILLPWSKQEIQEGKCPMMLNKQQMDCMEKVGDIALEQLFNRYSNTSRAVIMLIQQYLKFSYFMSSAIR